MSETYRGLAGLFHLMPLNLHWEDVRDGMLYQITYKTP